MLRRIYRCLLNLHPPRFRERFGEEMLSIFDESNEGADKGGTTRLFTDAATSFLRQWLVRPENWEDDVAEPISCASNGAPVFFTLDAHKLRAGALVSGGFVTLILFCAAWLVSEYTWTHPVYMPLTTVQVDTSYSAQPETSQRSPLPLATIPSQPAPAPQGSPASPPVEQGAETQPATPRQISSARNAAVPRPEKEAATPLSQPASTGINEGPASVDRSDRSIARVTASQDTVQFYVGIYAAAKVRVVITAENGHLTMEIPGEPKATLIPAGGTEFIFTGAHSGRVTFLKDESGVVSEIDVSQGTQWLRARRMPTKTTR